MSIRTEKVGALIHQEIASMLNRGEIKDPRIGPLVAITEVRVSRDLRHARLFVDVYGEADKDEVIKALTRAAGYIRNTLAKRLQLRHTPELLFTRDEAVEYGAHMDQVLRDLEIPPAEDEESEEPEGTP
ncbi:30S ribosome-binding factor RbfA [Magnetofaba australis]|uniref:Ribosome-binding factor A n=1 Tax=Magnetofaba australis IT-1 TaxID=1434232 RepID=A0A1Y2JZM6_9PROT|nr:30S ribosome-binding factor RbfA [Magnetofaba australis]OSM00358.1 putative ribosome-binding factor A [Magnetofaba australis IT-1]